MAYRAKLVRRTVAAANNRQLELSFDAQPDTIAAEPKSRPVRVIAIERVAAQVEMYSERGSSHSKAGTFYRVCVNHEYKGRFDSQGPMLWFTKPFHVQGIRLKFSDGQEITVYSQTLTVLKSFRSRFKRDGSFGMCPNKETILSALVYLRDDTPISWKQATELRIGTLVTNEKPFHWEGGRMTNGIISFPPVRPTGKQWSLYPIDAVPARRWDAFLEALKGRYHEDLATIRDAIVGNRGAA